MARKGDLEITETLTLVPGSSLFLLRIPLRFQYSPSFSVLFLALLVLESGRVVLLTTSTPCRHGEKRTKGASRKVSTARELLVLQFCNEEQRYRMGGFACVSTFACGMCVSQGRGE
jgi:hypothetical protein